MAPDDHSRRNSELLIVLRAQARDRQAFTELMDLYEARLFYFVRRLIPDTHRARDIIQDVWLEVFQSIDRLVAPAAFRVWLYRIAHDRAVRRLRRESLEVRAQKQLAAEARQEDSWNELQLLENAEAVHAALAKLSLLHREVMMLRFLEDMDVKTIAEVIGCSEGTAKSRLHHAKAELRKIIAGD